jgi:hypothetical protein
MVDVAVTVMTGIGAVDQMTNTTHSELIGMNVFALGLGADVLHFLAALLERRC